ncbi:hypothetical protein E2C01_024977 [Portunus trituberculatus]|uniref:Uncharacterized protein n=1 Tax=Portunus trituberculatus TaxID=210409 RepID=A0A5B7EBU7_PORTR|nr:hypothetical protein [Portunus trituberculatus]
MGSVRNREQDEAVKQLQEMVMALPTVRTDMLDEFIIASNNPSPPSLNADNASTVGPPTPATTGQGRAPKGPYFSFQCHNSNSHQLQNRTPFRTGRHRDKLRRIRDSRGGEVAESESVDISSVSPGHMSVKGLKVQHFLARPSREIASKRGIATMRYHVSPSQSPREVPSPPLSEPIIASGHLCCPTPRAR